MTKRNRYTPEFKSQIVLEIFKEEKSISELASQHGVHVNQLRQWKKLALEQMPQLFTKENKKQDQLVSDYEDQIQNLYTEVGKLTTQLSWLEKNLALRTRKERLDLLDWRIQNG
jgi:transposase-like protein